jgi:hypothetical protein
VSQLCQNSRGNITGQYMAVISVRNEDRDIDKQ